MCTLNVQNERNITRLSERGTPSSLASYRLPLEEREPSAKPMTDLEKTALPKANDSFSNAVANESGVGSEALTRVLTVSDHPSSAPQHQHQFSLLSAVGLAFAILNSWTAMAASLNLALPSGGATAVIWGVVVSGIGDLCIAASLAEICTFIHPLYHYSKL